MSIKRPSPLSPNSGERCDRLVVADEHQLPRAHGFVAAKPAALVCTSSLHAEAASVRTAPFMPSASPVS